MIRSGHVKEIDWNSGEWLFFDVGFSNNSKSCGLLVGDGTPREFRFNEVLDEIGVTILE